MTDSEKLDLILSEIQGVKSDMQGMKSEIQGIKSEIQDMKKKLDKLSLEELEIRKEIIMINRKISDTYNVALDALGTSVENRTWLEKGAFV